MGCLSGCLQGGTQRIAGGLQNLAQILRRVLQEEPALPTPWLQTSGLGNLRRYVSVIKASQFVVPRDGSPRTHTPGLAHCRANPVDPWLFAALSACGHVGVSQLCSRGLHRAKCS